MSDRLGRVNETFQRLLIYFITACTYRRQPILNNEDVHECLIAFASAGEIHGAWLALVSARGDEVKRKSLARFVESAKPFGHMTEFMRRSQTAPTKLDRSLVSA